jgi:predicted MFS family arabinose efflux permease
VKALLTNTRRLVSAGLAGSVVLGFTISLFGSSLKNTVQVFFLPMAQSFDESRGSFALATTIFAITYAVAAPLTGAIADRFGPGRVLLSGTVVAGLAFLLCATAPAFAVFVTTYGVLAAFAYAMLSYVPLGVLVDRLFADGRKGFFYALLTNGTAAGFILLVPLWTWLGQRHSWNTVLLVLGLTLLLVITPLTALRFRGEIHARPTVTPEVRPTVRSALSSSVFWRLTGAFFACGATMAFIDVHLVPYLDDMRVSADLSATSIVLLGVFEIAGSLAAGWLCDRNLVKAVLIAGYVVRAAALFLLAVAPNGPGVIAFGVVFGASYMVTVVATSVWVLRSFPIQIKGAVMGLAWTGHQIGAALSSQFGALSFDATGSYLPEILTIGTIALLAAALVATMPVPRPGAEPIPSHV